jgi:hypothetical protein
MECSRSAIAYQLIELLVTEWKTLGIHFIALREFDIVFVRPALGKAISFSCGEIAVSNKGQISSSDLIRQKNTQLTKAWECGIKVPEQE